VAGAGRGGGASGWVAVEVVTGFASAFKMSAMCGAALGQHKTRRRRWAHTQRQYTTGHTQGRLTLFFTTALDL
jgi:hypothetical protein